MKVTIFSTHRFDRKFLEEALHDYELKLLDVKLNADTVSLAKGSEAVAIFVNDDGSAPVLEKLKQEGIQYILLRSAGYNHIDLVAAKNLGLKVARVPKYSPAAVAEHTVALILALNRKLVKAHNRVRDMNFSLDGLVGFVLEGKTVGVVGTGNIGEIVTRILHGIGCKIVAFDPKPNNKLHARYDVTYTDLSTLIKTSDVITLHAPLTPDNKYLINKSTLDSMKPGVMLINTSRGALINTREVIEALKSGRVGSLGIDVYEEEEGLFFEDHSDNIIQDDTLLRLMSFQNVLITSHQAFLTQEALKSIAETTRYNLDCFGKGMPCKNELTV